MAIVRAEGELLVVPKGARIPKACIKCGATRDVVRYEQAYALGGGGAPFWIGGVLGAGAAAFVRNVFYDDPGLQALFIAGLIVAAVGWLFIAKKHTRTITLALPLCAEHDARLAAALRARTGVFAGMGVALVIALLGIALQSFCTAAFAGLLFALVVAFAFATRARDAWVHAQWVTDDVVKLRIGAELARSLAARAERREAKRARQAEASSS